MPHITDEQLQRLSDGTLETEQSEALWDHLDGCESCLDHLSQRIEEHRIPLTLDEEAVISNAFQSRLMRRINQEEGIRSILNFSYNGLATVFSLLLRTGWAFGSKLLPLTKVEVEKNDD